ncbi:MAG: hypothetical protein GYB31_07125 [Bacteroidetes bacterium]|nr:hypothetical protein [Bacteroidota bacterium]
MISAILSIFFLYQASFPTEDVQISFNVVHRGSEVGAVKVRKSVKGAEVYYTSYSETTTKVITSVHVISEVDVMVRNGVIRKSEAAITVNGKPRNSSSLSHTGSHYFMTIDDQLEKTINTNIHFVSTMLFFKEPVGFKTSFSEIDGTFHALEALGNHQYRKTDPRGRENIYYYKNGQLVKADIDAGMVSFEFVRQ